MRTFTQKRFFKREWLTSYLFLLPALSFFVIFVVIPMIKGIYISFFNYTGAQFDFIGLDNYIYLFQNEVFLKNIKDC